MNLDIEVHFNVVPVGKARPRFSHMTGVCYTPAPTRKAEAMIQSIANAKKLPKLDGPIAFRVVFNIPIPKSWPGWKKDAALLEQVLPTGKPDLDNLCKLLFDALQGICFNNDSQLVYGNCRKRYSDSPGITLRMEKLPDVKTKSDLSIFSRSMS